MTSTKWKHRTYPTGYKVEHCEYANPKRTLVVSIEKTIGFGRNGPMRGECVGDVTVDGSVIMIDPKDKGRILSGYNTLPCETFYVRQWGHKGAVSAARRYAKRTYRRFERAAR